MTKDELLNTAKFLADNTKLTEEDKAILQGFYEEIPDAVIAEKLGLKNKEIVRGKRQNICAKLGNTLIKYERMVRNDLSKFAGGENGNDR